MIVKHLTEHHLEFLSLKGGCRGSSESTLVKMSNCLKSYAAVHFIYFRARLMGFCFHLPERNRKVNPISDMN